jgi:hypothetical protein
MPLRKLTDVPTMADDKFNSRAEALDVVQEMSANLNNVNEEGFGAREIALCEEYLFEAKMYLAITDPVEVNEFAVI